MCRDVGCAWPLWLRWTRPAAALPCRGRGRDDSVGSRQEVNLRPRLTQTQTPCMSFQVEAR